MDTIDDIAGRLERAADRYHNAADFKSKNDALRAAEAVRRAGSVMEAQQIEQSFLRTHPPDGGSATFTQNQQQQQPSGCLGGWFNIFSGGGQRSGPWRGSLSGPRYTSSYYYDTWTGSDFADLTFTNALLRSMPPHVHDRQAYVRQMSQQTGIHPNARVGDLSNDQVSALSTTLANDWESSAGSFGSSGADFGSSDDSSRDSGSRSGGGGSFGAVDKDFGSSRSDDATPASSFGSSGSDFGSSDDASSGGSFGSSGSDFGSSSPSDNS
jgi:hypothetical protein